MQSPPLDAGTPPVARAPSPSAPRGPVDAVDVVTPPWRRHGAWAALGANAPARVGTAEPSPGPSRASSPGVDDAFSLLDGASGWTTAASRSPSPSPSPSPRGGVPRVRRVLDRLPSVEAVLAKRGASRSPSVGDDATVYGSGEEMLDDADGVAAGAGHSEASSASDAELEVQGEPSTRPADPVGAAGANPSRLGLPAHVLTGLAVGVSLVLASRAYASLVRSDETAAWGRQRAADAAARLWGQTARDVAAAGAEGGPWPRLRVAAAAAALNRGASRTFANVPKLAAAYADVRHRLGPAHDAFAQGAASLRAGLQQAARRLADAAAQG